MEVIETIAAGKTRRLAEDGGVRNENRLSLYPPGWTNRTYASVGMALKMIDAFLDSQRGFRTTLGAGD